MSTPSARSRFAGRARDGPRDRLCPPRARLGFVERQGRRVRARTLAEQVRCVVAETVRKARSTLPRRGEVRLAKPHAIEARRRDIDVRAHSPQGLSGADGSVHACRLSRTWTKQKDISTYQTVTPADRDISRSRHQQTRGNRAIPAAANPPAAPVEPDRQRAELPRSTHCFYRQLCPCRTPSYSSRPPSCPNHNAHYPLHNSRRYRSIVHTKHQPNIEWNLSIRHQMPQYTSESVFVVLQQCP